jgi:hypothetical protein
VLLPLPLLFSLDVEKGKQDAAAFAYKSRRQRKGEE